MKTRAKTLKKSIAAKEGWDKQQQKNNNISAKLFKARQDRYSTTKVRKITEKIEPKMRDVSVQTEPEMRDVSVQTESETRDISVMTTYETKKVFVQTINNKNSIAIQTTACMPKSVLPLSPTFGGRPRMPLENLSNVRIKGIARELANFHRERTPNAEGNPLTHDIFRFAKHSLNVFTPKKEEHNKLTIYQEIFAILSAGISFHAREKLKKTLATFGFNIFVSKREFFTTKNKISAGLELKWTNNYLNCINIKEVIEKRIEQLRLTDMFVGIPSIVLMGDKGSTTTKIAVLPVIKRKTNATANLTIISIWEGNDDRQSLKNNEEIFNQLKEIKNVNWILTGDLKFLSALLCHRGACSNYPCCICRTPKEQLENKGRMREYNDTELNYSFVDIPLFSILPAQVMPPPLHITHGVATRAINILELIVDKKIMIEFLQNNHIRRDPRTKAFRGNDLVKLLHTEVEKNSLSRLVDLQEFEQAAALWHKLIEGVRWWFTKSSAQLFDDPMEQADLVDKGAKILYKMFNVLKNHLENIAKNSNNDLVRKKAENAAKKCRIFPKLHYLLHHCAAFIKTTGWWGVASEQAIESYHAVFNKLELRFRNVKDRKIQVERMMRHQFLLNYLHDKGLND